MVSVRFPSLHGRCAQEAGGRDPLGGEFADAKEPGARARLKVGGPTQLDLARARHRYPHRAIKNMYAPRRLPLALVLLLRLCAVQDLEEPAGADAHARVEVGLGALDVVVERVAEELYVWQGGRCQDERGRLTGRRGDERERGDGPGSG